MMKLKNPEFKVGENHIFSIRQTEYDNLMHSVREILKPVEEIGFEIEDCILKESKMSSGELHKTLKKTIGIKIKKDNTVIDLNFHIPKLIDGNYILINGRRKIPLFQLFDIPVVTRGKFIKIRTNVATLMLFEKKESPYVYLSVLGKKVPMFLIMFAYYGAEALNDRFNFDTLDIAPTSLYNKLLYDLKEFYIEGGDIEREDLIIEIGRIYTKYNFKEKGETLLYALDLIVKTDTMALKFFNTTSIIEEILYVLQHGESYDDTDFENKRIRCFEYLILSSVSKAIFDLCIANRTAKRPKFNINSTEILSKCNVSDIVQFDFSINPIEELTKLSRSSLVGPGGFKRENVPEHLRDLSDSMYGRICPVDTPDRDNCGVLQNLLVNTKLDENLRFAPDMLANSPISIPVSMVPFLEHDDQTRLQMASSQMRQAIMLKKFQSPMIQSGCEGLYTDHTQFVKRAKRDGEIIYVNNKYLMIAYDNNEIELINTSYRRIYVENMDLINVYVKQGDKVRRGEILAESNYCQDGNITIGQNLLTAVMVYYGYNYEDGIVISDRLIEDGTLTSVHYKDLSFVIPPDRVLLSLDPNTYKPLPNILEKVMVKEPYAIMKKMPSGPTDFCNVFEEPVSLTAKKPLVISELSIYPNMWNTEVPEYKDWVEALIDTQLKKQEEVHTVINDRLDKQNAKQFIRDNQLDMFSHVGKYKSKKETVNGIRVEMFALYTRKIMMGDKIGNRHGNKGVISTVVPHEQMPQLKDGRHVDICINPLGIVSRMNIGQLFELHLAMSLEDLRNTANEMLINKNTQDEIKKYLIDYIKIIDNTKTGWYSKQFIGLLPDTITKDYLDNLYLIQPPFESVTAAILERAMVYTNTLYEQRVYDPISGKHTVEPVAVGNMYFFRMVHIAESRLAARGIGSYARRTLQPLAGRKNRGGQRCGEMETACLIAHDAPKNMFEFLTTKSDCIDLKNRFIRETIETDLVKEVQDDSIKPESVNLLESYLITIGIDKE